MPSKEPPPSVRLEIAENGSFVGGDRLQATNLVTELLDRSLEARSVDLGAQWLADQQRLLHRSDAEVDADADLRDALRLTAKAMSLLFQGGVHYYLQWKESDLIEAVLEVRKIAMRGLSDREWWYVWPDSNPMEILEVRLTHDESQLVRTGYYEVRTSDGKAERREGVTREEPIWLRNIDPSIVWRRVAPAVAVHVATQGAKSVVDVSDWVISNWRPRELSQTHPTGNTIGQAPHWTW